MGWRGVLRVIELLGRWSPEVSGPAQPILARSVPGPPPPPLPLMSGTQRGCMWEELPVRLCPGPSDLGRTGPRSVRPWWCPSMRGIALGSPPPRGGESPEDRAPSGQHPSVSWLQAESPLGLQAAGGEWGPVWEMVKVPPPCVAGLRPLVPKASGAQPPLPGAGGAHLRPQSGSCQQQQQHHLERCQECLRFPDGSAGKESACNERPGFNPCVGKTPWRRERLPTPVFWPGEFHGLCSLWGHKESDTTE